MYDVQKNDDMHKMYDDSLKVYGDKHEMYDETIEIHDDILEMPFYYQFTWSNNKEEMEILLQVGNKVYFWYCF